MQLARLHANLPLADLEFIKENIGLSVQALFKDLALPGAVIESLISDFRDCLKKIPLKPENKFGGVDDLLIYLKSKNLKLGIATNKPTYLAKIALVQVEIDKYFDSIVGADNIEAKPNPAVILENLRILGSNRLTTMMVGDRVEDILAAKRASIRSIGVAQGVHSMNSLIAANADLVFSSMSEMYIEFRNGVDFENF